MKKAIIIGANGYIGSATLRKLLENNVEILAISRQGDDQFFANFNLHKYNLTHINLDLKDIQELPRIIEEKKWTIGDECVFYNFAWSGLERLMDGTIEDQLINVTYLSNSLKIASQLGCSKFINSGSIEESFAEIFLKKSWNLIKFPTKNGNYAASKIAARNMCKLLGYLYKIDYVHTRISAVIDKNLSGQGYIENVFRKILKNESYERPENENLFDILDIDDVALAYYLLGIYGKNKVDYFIGSGFPIKLLDYFENFANWYKLGVLPQKKYYKENEIFNTALLKRDTGLDLKDSFEKAINKI